MLSLLVSIHVGIDRRTWVRGMLACSHWRSLWRVGYLPLRAPGRPLAALLTHAGTLCDPDVIWRAPERFWCPYGHLEGDLTEASRGPRIPPMNELPRTIVLGRTGLACSIAEYLLAEGALAGVVPGRSEPAWAPKLRTWATQRGVPVLSHEAACAGRPALALSILYDRLFTPEELEGLGRAVNFHPGPLPAYRGCNPVNWALRNGETQHGVTLHEIDAGIDTGPILAEARFPVYPGDEVKDLYFRSLAYGERLLRDTLPRLAQLRATPQTGPGRLYRVRDRGKLGDRAGWTRAES